MIKPATLNEIKFLSEKSSQSIDVIRSLTEEERDLDLLLDSLVPDKLDILDIKKLSIINKIKVVVFQYSKKESFDVGEKSYVAKAIFSHYSSIQEKVNFKLIGGEPSEKAAQYYLVLSGFYNDLIKPSFFDKQHIRFMENGFRPKQRELSKHVQIWINILRGIKEQMKKAKQV